MTMNQTQARPSVIEVSGVSKRFILRKDNSIKERIVTLGRAGRRHRVDFWALKDVDVTIEAGTTIGLIGHNGSGKSTLLKTLGGIIEPSSGVVRVRGRVASLLELGAGFHPDLTGRENIFLNASLLGMSRAETAARFDEIVEFSGIAEFIDTQVKFYSSGMYVRLAFAVAIHTEPDILLVDEVLAVGDEAFQRKCLDRIRQFQSEGRTIILVTHSMAQVLDFCDRAVLLHHGEVELDGRPNDAVKRFRDLLEDARLSDMSEEQLAAEDAIRIVEASARVSGPELQVGDSLHLEFDIESDQLVEGWNLGIQVDNVSGQGIYSTSAKRMGVVLDPLHGRVRAEFTLTDCHFGGGRYFVNVSVMDARGVHLKDARAAVSFVAREQADFVGAAIAAPSLSVSAF